MKLLVEMVSISGGGGAEQAIAFLEEIQRSRSSGISLICVVRKSTRIEDYLSGTDIEYEVIENGIFSRVKYTIHAGRRILYKHNADAVFVVFGIGISVPRNVVQVINVALPIICYWDSPYWKYLSVIEYAKRALKSKVRAYLIKRRAGHVVVESKVMQERLVKYAGIDSRSISVIPPIMGKVADRLNNKDRASIRELRSMTRTNFLFVTGPDHHKNLWRLLGVARELRARHREGPIFQMTITEAEFEACCAGAGQIRLEEADLQYFRFLDRLHDQALSEAYLRSDVVANISDLESISNNFIEAYAATKPMLISNRDFSLESVRVPHVVCEPHCVNSLLAALERCCAGDFDSPSKFRPVYIGAEERVDMVLRLFEAGR